MNIHSSRAIPSRPFCRKAGPKGPASDCWKSELPRKIFETRMQGEKPSAEFRRPQAAKSSSNPFFPGTCASEKTLLSPQTCELRLLQRVRYSGLHPLEKMQAFFRSVSRSLDTLTPAPMGPAFFASVGKEPPRSGTALMSLYDQASVWATTLVARTPLAPRGSGSVSKVTF